MRPPATRGRGRPPKARENQRLNRTFRATSSEWADVLHAGIDRVRLAATLMAAQLRDLEARGVDTLRPLTITVPAPYLGNIRARAHSTSWDPNRVVARLAAAEPGAESLTDPATLTRAQARAAAVAIAESALESAGMPSYGELARILHALHRAAQAAALAGTLSRNTLTYRTTRETARRLRAVGIAPT